MANGANAVTAGAAPAHYAQPLVEFPQPFQAGLRQGTGINVLQRLAQAAVMLRGAGAQCLQCGRAQLAAWHVGNAQEGVVVVLVHQQPQVGHDVLHFVAGKERGAPTQVVGHLLLLQRQFQQAGLVVAAV